MAQAILKIVVLALAVLLSSCAKEEEGITRKERAQLIAMTKDYVAAHLTDPDSARFRNTRVYEHGLFGGIVVCGEFNAKNRLGGYVGYRRFIYNGPHKRNVVFDPSVEEVKGWCSKWE